MVRPSSTAETIVAKLSSSSTMSAASLATSVPVIPMATPMSAFFRAGASLTPSPVMATTSPRSCSAWMISSLCSGETREYTETSPIRSARPATPNSSSSLPIRTPPVETMPAWAAMVRAVSGWSPVIMIGRIPAFRQRATASRASLRSGSIMATRPRKRQALAGIPQDPASRELSPGGRPLPAPVDPGLPGRRPAVKLQPEVPGRQHRSA